MKTCELTIKKQPDGLFKATLSEVVSERPGLAGTQVHILRERFDTAEDAEAAARQDATNRGLTVNGASNLDEFSSNPM